MRRKTEPILSGGFMPRMQGGQLGERDVWVTPASHELMHQSLKLAANGGHIAIGCEVCGVQSGAIGFIDTTAMERRLADLAALPDLDDDTYKRPVQPHRRNLYPAFPKDWTNKTFDTFREDDDNRNALELAHGWAEKPEGVLVYHGPTGTGKTHLLAAIAQWIEGAGIDVSAWEFDLWVNTLRDVFAAEGRDEVNAFTTRMINAKVLIMDEVRAERTSDAIRDMFEQVVNRRTAEGKPMLITTNASEEEWSGWSQRAYSRLRASQYSLWIPMSGDDRRMVEL